MHKISKEDIVTFFLVVTVFLFFIFTPGRETLGSAVQGFIIAFIFFGFLPLGYHFLVLKKSARSFGLGKEDAWSRWPLIIPVVLAALVVTVLSYRFFPGFSQGFLLPEVVAGSALRFAAYELLLVPVLIALYEIFFRGFIQKSWLEKYFGAGAIVAQSLVFVAFLLLTGSFGWAFFPFVLFSLFSGYLVWQNNSLTQAWLASWLYLIAFDLFVLIMR